MGVHIFFLWMKGLLTYFAHFNLFGYMSFLSCKNYLYILNASALSDIFLQIVSVSLWFAFSFSQLSLSRAKGL